MESISLKNEHNKTESFRANEKLNKLLEELKEQLLPVQNKIDCPALPQWPVGCIIGNPRTGSTMLLQVLASIGVFSYPTNILTRFSYAPYIGALIQKMLFDGKYDFNGDFLDIQQSKINFSSDLGKSKGALAVNEFQHFFRNYMPNFDIEWLSDNILQTIDCCALIKDLASIEKAFERPFVTKANILQYNLDYFTKKMPSLFFIYIKREPIYTMQSLLLSREKYYGSRNVWWSVKPKEYNFLKDMNIFHQIAGQVYFTDKTIAQKLQSISKKKQMTVKYELFCDNPESVYYRIVERYAALGCALKSEYNGPTSFGCGNKIKLPNNDIDSLQAAYDDFVSGKIKPS